MIRRVLLAALLLWLPLFTTSALAADVDGALAYVPTDSFGVVVAKLDKLSTSPLIAQAKQLMFTENPKAKENLDKLAKATGFDPFRDAKTLAVAVGPDVFKNDDHFVAVIEAKIDEARLIAFVKKEGGKMQPKTGASGKYYEIGKRGDGRIAFRGNFVIVGAGSPFDKALLKQGIAPGLRAQLKPHEGQEIFAAINVIAEAQMEIAREQKELADLKAAAGGLSISPGLDLSLIAEFASSKAPTMLAKLANDGLDEVGKSREVKRMGVANMLAKVKVRAAGNKLIGDLKLSEADVKKLIELFKTFL
jgi:hypothetical protein